MSLQLLTIKDAANLLQVKERTFRTWMQRGQIPESIIFGIGANKRIRLKKFEEWVNGDDSLQKE